VATPGSGILEVSLVGTRALACARIDPLTYFLGKLLVKTKFFTLPNLLLLKKIVPEYLSPVSFFYKKEVSSIVEELQKTEKEDYSSQASALQKKCEGTPIKCLALEFLMDVLNRDSEQGRLSIRRN
jgi:lipid-A-disaccharide synthase